MGVEKQVIIELKALGGHPPLSTESKAIISYLEKILPRSSRQGKDYYSIHKYEDEA